MWKVNKGFQGRSTSSKVLVKKKTKDRDRAITVYLKFILFVVYTSLNNISKMVENKNELIVSVLLWWIVGKFFSLNWSRAFVCLLSPWVFVTCMLGWLVNLCWLLESVSRCVLLYLSFICIATGELFWSNLESHFRLLKLSSDDIKYGLTPKWDNGVTGLNVLCTNGLFLHWIVAKTDVLYVTSSAKGYEALIEAKRMFLWSCCLPGGIQSHLKAKHNF